MGILELSSLSEVNMYISIFFSHPLVRNFEDKTCHNENFSQHEQLNQTFCLVGITSDSTKRPFPLYNGPYAT